MKGVHSESCTFSLLWRCCRCCLCCFVHNVSSTIFVNIHIDVVVSRRFAEFLEPVAWLGCLFCFYLYLNIPFALLFFFFSPSLGLPYVGGRWQGLKAPWIVWVFSVSFDAVPSASQVFSSAVSNFLCFPSQTLWSLSSSPKVRFNFFFLTILETFYLC